MFLNLRRGLQSFARYPGSNVALVLALAAGLGAGTSVFTVLNATLLRMPAGVTDPGSLATLQMFSVEKGYQGFSYSDFVEYRRRARSFAGLAAARPTRLILSGRGEPAALRGMLVTEGYLRVLGVPMARGRDFAPEEAVSTGAVPAVILNHRLWRNRFGADPHLIGERIRLNGAWFTVVGVTASGFEGLDVTEQVDIWLPLATELQIHPQFSVLNNDLFASVAPVGRLKPGVSLARAREEMAVLARRIERPPGDAGRALHVILTRPGFSDPAWRDLVISWSVPVASAALLLLALIIINVSGILLLRSAPRRRETAVRLALGAGTGHILRELVAGAFVLALPAAAGGLIVSSWVDALISAEEDIQFPMDHRVILFAAGLALVSCCLAGLLPAMDAIRREPARELRDRGITAPPSGLRRAVITGQIAASLTLLTVAMLMVRSFDVESSRDLGFDASSVFLVPLDLRLAGYGNEEAQAVRRRLLAAIGAVPGVRMAAAAGAPPIDRGFAWGPLRVVPEDGSEDITVQRNAVGPGYVDILGTGIVAGRDFTEDDRDGAPGVVIVNQTMAARLGPGSVLGRTVRFRGFMGLGQPLEIVGVTPDIRVASRELDAEPEILLPLAQLDGPDATLLFRPVGNPKRVVAAIRAVIRRLVPDLPAPHIESVRDRRDRTLTDDRVHAELTILFALVGLLVAALGLYATISFDVAQRHHQFGVRMALGARTGQIRAMVLRDTVRMVLIGVAAGLAGSVAAGRLLQSALYGVPSTDPASFALATVTLVTVAGVTAWLSTHRITALDPAAALRSHQE